MPCRSASRFIAVALVAGVAIGPLAPSAVAQYTTGRGQWPAPGSTDAQHPPSGPREVPGHEIPGGQPEGPRHKSSSRSIVPGVLAGAAALVIIGALLAQEKSPPPQPDPNTPSPDEVVDRLLRDGPQLASAFNMSAFAVRGFVRGGWPVVVDFQQRSRGRTVLSISARDLPEVYTFELGRACPPPRRCLIVFKLPEDLFGNELRPAVLAALASDESGRQTLAAFDVYALGAGPKAVGSSAIDQVSFGPPVIRVAAGETAGYRFYSHSDFSSMAVEFWRIDTAEDGTHHYFVDDRLIGGGIRKDHWLEPDPALAWNGMERDQRVSTGRHKLHVRAWDRAGDWELVWSDSVVRVAQ